MKEKVLKVLFSALLNKRKIYGRRANNSDICANNSVLKVCAFTSEDCIYWEPSRDREKEYNELKEGEVNEQSHD